MESYLTLEIMSSKIMDSCFEKPNIFLPIYLMKTLIR